LGTNTEPTIYDMVKTILTIIKEYKKQQDEILLRLNRIEKSVNKIDK
jgi:hypothetical protein